MHKFMVVGATVVLCSVFAMGQDESVETFNAIRLENSTNPGETITLSAPTGTVSYSLTLPATAPSNTTQRWAFSLNGSSNNLTWYATPLGSPGQLPYFQTTEEIVGSPYLLWDNSTQKLEVSGIGSGVLASFSKSATDLSGNETVLKIASTSPSTAGSVTKTLLSLSATGSTGSTSTVRGIAVDVTGGTNNYPATFVGGNVGIGTSTPNVVLDIEGSIAYREYNYTGSLSATNNNIDFTGGGNTRSFVRVASSITANVSLTGFAGGYSGKILNVYNATSEGLRIVNESTNSSAANRIMTAGGDLMISPGMNYQFIYSAMDQRWIVTTASPGGITSLGEESVNLQADGTALPSSTASYIQVTAPTSICSSSGCNVSLEDGVNVGQILVVQNNGPRPIKFTGTNMATTNSTSTLQAAETIPFMWSGTRWVQMASASN
ncbi:MAG: hypothetical protein HYX66_00670 [Ignavibacteria bacterium]|nr:hypothetical protein [Ignavibacteria bacterium]